MREISILVVDPAIGAHSHRRTELALHIDRARSAETKELIDPEAPYDTYALPAERGSVLTMLNPRFTVAIPEGATVKMPLAYSIAGNDPNWVRYINSWIELKKRDGFIHTLYEHWILGKNATHKEPRWSVIRDVLYWVN